MSTHPNAMLMVVFTPDALARSTCRNILVELGETDLESPYPKIGEKNYHVQIMENNYEEGFQIGAEEGDIVFFDYVTYGYGESVTWSNLETQKIDLENWARDICERHHCRYEIRISANYW